MVVRVIKMLEFKLQFYFKMFKDKPFKNAKVFKSEFIKKYCNFEYLNELVIMITNYQIKKYGYSLCPSYYTPIITKEDSKRILNNANHRERNRKRK